MIDIPPMTGQDIAAWVAVIGGCSWATWYVVVLILRMSFVTKAHFWSQQKKVEKVFEEHLALIQKTHATATQSDSKAHELLHAVKGLTHEVSEQKQVTRDNTAATNRLSEKFAVMEAVQKVKDQK